jgi:CBS domain-containing protein
MAYLAQQLFEDHARLAEEFRKATGMLAEQVMTREVITCSPGTPVEEIATTMARRHLRRLPVVENDLLVGIVSRADVLRAAESRLARPESPPPLTDHQIRLRLLESLKREPWAEVERLEVEVSAGRVVLRGMAESLQEREAIELAARAIAGVTGVVNELAVAPDLES